MEENEEDIRYYLRTLKGLIQAEREVREYIQIQLEDVKRRISDSELSEEDKNAYMSELRRLEKFYRNEDEESNCLPCYG